ncbi:MAG: hypothetical protein P8N02_06130, partial [Actinomycetota bacterium]|nr:hypothetical protein [Actinomycetota bacterium]
MAAPYDPRPTADRSTGDVAITRVHTGNIEQFEQHLRASVARAIDTETVYNPLGFDAGPGPLRVVSAPTPAAAGTERAW